MRYSTSINPESVLYAFGVNMSFLSTIKYFFHRLHIKCACRILSSLSKRTYGSNELSNEVLLALAPFYSQLVSMHGAATDPALRSLLFAINQMIATNKANDFDYRLQSVLFAFSSVIDKDRWNSIASTWQEAIYAWSQLIAENDAESESKAKAKAMIRTLFAMQFPPEVRALIPPLIKRDAPVMNTWVYQNTVMQWDIPPDALVLDIGSGGWPFKRADHLADKYPDKTTHRAETMVRDERPFFEVDLEHLPFDDKAYDFVFCSHVLEHMDNPGKALRELMRIGKRGYIEVPTRLSDVMLNFTRLPDHHRWHGLLLGKILVLIEWNDWERRELGNYFFDALQSDYSNQFQDFFEQNRDLFYVSLTWADTIKFLIIDKHGKVIDSSES